MALKSLVIDQVHDFIRIRSTQMLKAYVGISDVSEEKVEGDLSVFGHWMTLIMVVGGPLRITFKAHFMEGEAKALLANLTQRDPNGISEDTAIDFMKEFCNTVAGSLKKGLLAAGMSTGISLPIVTRGFDELFFSKADGVTSFGAAWKFRSSIGELACSYVFDVMSPSEIEGLKLSPTDPESDSSGELEFL